MLTEKQSKLLNLLDTYVEKNKISPTIRELCDMMNLKSTSTIYGYLQRLKKEGRIIWQKGSPRTIQILK